MEDLSPLKPVEDKTSPDQFQSSPDSQFSFDGLSGSQKSATVEVVKPRNDSANEVAFSDNFSSGYAEMEDTMRSDISVVQKEDPAIEFQAPNADQPSPEVNIGEFKSDGNFDINFGVPSDPFLGGNDVPAISTLGSLNRQENLDFNGDVAGNPDLAGENSFPREDLSNDFSPQNFELNAGSTNNPFTAGNFVPRDGTVQENFGLNADVSSNAFLSGNSTPREGSPSFKTDADERETLRQLVKDVRVEDHTSDLDQSITKVSTTTEINSAFLVSDSKASYEPDINFRPPKEREQKATPETVYNKMYNVSNGNDTSPVHWLPFGTCTPSSTASASVLFTASLCMNSNLLDIVFDFLFWSSGIDLCYSRTNILHTVVPVYMFSGINISLLIFNIIFWMCRCLRIS